MKDKLLKFLKTEIINNPSINDENLTDYLYIIHGISIDNMIKELQIGIDNGYSIEQQFAIIKSILKNQL